MRGLIGPRESSRIWSRHLLNCAALGELVPYGSYLVDIGSGAGLPGIVLAVARPDLSVVLIESLARRVAFLTEVVDQLDLTQVSVVHARAEDCFAAVSPAAVVTARAVASLDRLLAWGLPLTAVGGRLLAIKGAAAEAEVAEYGDHALRFGGTRPVIRRCGVGTVDPPVTVVEVLRERDITPGPATRGSAAPGAVSPRSGHKGSRTVTGRVRGGRGRQDPEARGRN